MMPATHFSTEDFAETGEVFCTIEGFWTTTIPAGDTGPGYPICVASNTILYDDVVDPAHHKLIDLRWYCKGKDINFPEVPDACPNCGESIVRDAGTVLGISTLTDDPDPDDPETLDPTTLPDREVIEIDPTTEPPPYEEP